MKTLNQTLLRDLLAIEKAVLEHIREEVKANRLGWCRTQDQLLGRVLPLEALLEEQMPPQQEDVERMIADLRTHAFDDSGERDLPTHIANQAADMLAALASQSDASPPLVGVEELREAGFDAAVAAVEEWAGGMYSQGTKDRLYAVAQDLRQNKATILSRVSGDKS